MTRTCVDQRLIWIVCCCGWALFIQTGSASAQQPLWASTTKSSGQHPIEVARFGKGTQNVLIVGSLLGNEPESLELMDAAGHLAQKIAPPEPVTLLMVRTLNPDGVADLVHTNSRGVELSRNFPSRYFTSIPNRLTGPAAASEVETQYMLRVLAEYKPVRVIHVRSGMGDRPLVMVNSLWLSSGKPPVLPTDVNQGYFDQSYKAGSLEEYVAREMKSSVATVTLANHGSRQLQAAELLRFATSNIDSNEAPDAIVEQPKTTEPGMTSQPQPEVPAVVKSAEEVEFLPTPPEYLTTAHPGGTDDTADQRYFELPSPPR